MEQAALIDRIAAWCGFLGAWALVAGPVYQGAVELGEMQVDRSAIHSLAEVVPPREPISPWWWLVPPVAYVKASRRGDAWRRVMAAMTPQQRLQLVTFGSKATGWFVVGAALIGVQQAVALVEALGWPSLATVPVVLLAAAAATAFTVYRMRLSQRALDAAVVERGTPVALREHDP